MRFLEPHETKRTTYRSLAKKYASDLSRKNELQQNVPTSTPETSIADLGWKELKPSGLRKGKGKQMHVDPEEEALKAEERRLAATVSVFAKPPCPLSTEISKGAPLEAFERAISPLDS